MEHHHREGVSAPAPETVHAPLKAICAPAGDASAGAFFVGSKRFAPAAIQSPQISPESAKILSKYCRCAPGRFGLYWYLSTARCGGPVIPCHPPAHTRRALPKGDFFTNYLFQFARILAFCFLGEVLHAVLPLPIPASVYGLILLLAALKLGFVKLEQVKEVGLFLTGIFPLLFVPAAAGVMELWAEMGNMLLPIVLAIVPVTVLVLASAGRTTQALTRRKNKEVPHDGAAE